MMVDLAVVVKYLWFKLEGAVLQVDGKCVCGEGRAVQ